MAKSWNRANLAAELRHITHAPKRTLFRLILRTSNGGGALVGVFCDLSCVTRYGVPGHDDQQEPSLNAAA
jgi:hypothetical protein